MSWRRRVSIREQLDWCAAESVTRAVFTHCGSQMIRDEEALERRVAALGASEGSGPPSPTTAFDWC